MPTCCTVLVAAGALLLIHVSSAQYSRRSTPVGYAEEVLHEHSLSNYRYANPQRRNSKSLAFLDYFFPPSRTPKVSSAFAEPRKSESDSATVNSSSTTEGTTHPVQISTQDEGRATGSTRKSTTTKRKSTSSRLPASTTPKNKASTEKTTTKYATPSRTSTASQKTTHKHYTIYPTIAKSNPTVTGKSGNATVGTTTQGIQKVTELGKVSATEKTTAGTSPAETSSTEIDGREGEYELKPEKQPSNDQPNKESVALPAGSTSVLAKPTKYHYYPHNQHIYLLPECAIQQVCNAVYVRLNYTQPLCACPSRHRDPCSASLNADDLHTTLLTTDSKKKYAHKAITLVKTCEATSEMRECRAPRDWSLLALQNIRTGKSHYLVICRCPEEFVLEGPMSHDQPTYASVPGIRVYGMMCVQPTQTQSTAAFNSVTTRPTTNSYKVGYSQPPFNQDQTHSRYPGYAGPGLYYNRMARRIRDTSRVMKGFHREDTPPFPWEKARELALTANWDN